MRSRRARVGSTATCRHCARPIETHDYDWAGGIQWRHIGGHTDCRTRRAEPLRGRRYRGHPMPPDIDEWTESKQDGVRRYIDFLLELEGIPRRSIRNGS